MHIPNPRRSRRRLAVLVAGVSLAVVAALMVGEGSGPDAQANPQTGQQDLATDRTSLRQVTAPASSAGAGGAATTRAKGKGARVLFFGDSYFIGHAEIGPSQTMAGRVGRTFGWRSAIKGGGGTGFVRANPEYDLPNFLGQINQGAFDVGSRRWVIIEGGSDDRYLITAAINKNARKVLRIAKKRFPGAKVVLMGPLDVDGNYSDDRPVNRALRKAAKTKGVPFINAMKWLQGRLELVGPDYVHPTAKGHRFLAKKLAAALRKRGA